MSFVLIYNYKLTNNGNYDKIYYVNNKCIFKIKERKNKTIIVLWVLTMKSKNVFRKLVIGIMITSVLMLVGCGSKDAASYKELEKETTKKEVVEETTKEVVEETTSEFNVTKYKFKGKMFFCDSEGVFQKMNGFALNPGDSVFVNYFEGENESDLSRGYMAEALLYLAGYDTVQMLEQYESGHETYCIPYEDNYNFVYNGTKILKWEFVGKSNGNYYFDVYPQ